MNKKNDFQCLSPEQLKNYVMNILSWFITHHNFHIWFYIYWFIRSYCILPCAIASFCAILMRLCRVVSHHLGWLQPIVLKGWYFHQLVGRFLWFFFVFSSSPRQFNLLNCTQLRWVRHWKAG
jgi:hypothetical protein